jgi:hypothetical protein
VCSARIGTDINKGVAMEIEGHYLNAEQRFDYAERLAKLQAEEIVEAQERVSGKLTYAWQRRVVELETSVLMQDYIKAHWHEYGYDETKEIGYLRKHVSDDDAKRAMSFVIDEGVE